MNSTSKSLVDTSVIAIAALAIAFLVFPVVTFAQTTATGIRVKGDFPGSTLPTGSVVTVTCGSQTSSPSTDNKGKFSTVFNITADCNKGTNITGLSGDYNGTAKVANGFNTNTLQMRRVEAVPEIGTIAGIASLAAAGGAIVYARRRQVMA